jgi:hypothetical protein
LMALILLRLLLVVAAAVVVVVAVVLVQFLGHAPNPAAAALLAAVVVVVVVARTAVASAAAGQSGLAQSPLFSVFVVTARLLEGAKSGAIASTNQTVGRLKAAATPLSVASARHA